MDEKKKHLKLQDHICLFIFIDKALHAASLQNSRVTISICLHPSIYPVSSSPILVQFNHIRFSLGLITHFSAFLSKGISSVSDLKLQIILRDSLTSRLIGKCLVPLNPKNEFIYFSQKIEDLPYFFHQSSTFPVFSQKHSKDDGSPTKVEICQLILTVAIGKESDKEKIMPNEVSSQEQIRFKRNYNPKSTYSPPLSHNSIHLKLQNKDINSHLSDADIFLSNSSESSKSFDQKDISTNSEKPKMKQKIIYKEQCKRISSSNNLKPIHLNINDQNNFNINLNKHKISNPHKTFNEFHNKSHFFSRKKNNYLTKDQIQFVIDNWEKYALQSGWSPPQIKQKNINKKFHVSSPTNQQTNKPKFSGLFVRKLIKISPKGSTIVISNQYDSDNNHTDDQNNENSKYDNKNTNENENNKKIIEYSDNSSDTLKIKNMKSNPISSHNKNNFKKKKKKNFTRLLNESNDDEDKLPKRGQSVGPKGTTQYQLMNEFSLDDDFPDKVQKCFNSDPPPRLPTINEYESSSEDENPSPIDICENDSDFERTVMSSPGFLATMSPTVSNDEEFFSQNDSYEYKSSVLLKKGQIIQPKEENNNFPNLLNSKVSSPSSIISLQEETELVNGLETKNRNINFDEENFDEITKSSFESLEAMIKVPPKSPHLKYSIVHFDNLFDLAPSINFGKKEIISIQVFRARPNPSEKLNTIYFSMKSEANQKKEKIPPPLPLKSLSEPQISIKKSPSLEKIFQDGYMDSIFNISGIYNESSSEG